jgi:arylsulfatase A-like enzyme
VPWLVADDDYLLDLRRRYGPEADYLDGGMGCNGYAVSPWPYDPMLHPTAWVTSQSIDFLRRRDPTKPFLLVASYFHPHPPIVPPPAYLDLYRDVPLPPLPHGDWVGTEHAPNVSQRSHDHDSPKALDAAQADRARRGYYAQITFIDHQINRLMMALFEHGVLENTAVVFVSDHGDMLFDHELVAKMVPYQGSTGVPMIVRPPRNMQIAGGRVVDAPVELRDILPTLCDLAGIDTPEGIDGKSLMPFVRGETPAWRAYLHGEHAAGEWSNHYLTDGKQKYAWYSQTGYEQLFDLQNDPQECHDIAADQPETTAMWRARLVQELEGREEGYVQNGQLVTGRPASPILKEAGLKA